MNATTSLSPEHLNTLEVQAIAQLNACANLTELEHAKVELLGRSGSLTLLKRGLKDVPAEDRPAVGALLNALSQAVEVVHDEIKARLDAKALALQLHAETLDVTMPGRHVPVGKVHPLSQITEDVCRLFEGMGFSVLDDNACPEVETEFFNFEALNFPADHPARDMQDTYYTEVASHVLLRSQTSNAQIRHMSQHKPPIRVIAPGRVYRNEEVSSRKYVLFHQIEGLYVDKNVTFADLKGTLK